VVVSIFVNPAQFAPSEDFGSYPRTFPADLAALRKAAADLVWAPAATAEIYPPDFATDVVPRGPAVVGLEDAFRPHFFTGVATVVAKLLLQCLPDIAVFGEKDFQQLRVVERMVADLDIPVKIVGAKTVRERDGLAMSSRNVYLSAAERAQAALLHATLTACAHDIRAGKSIAAALRRARAAIERAGFELDYCEARNARTLEPVRPREHGPVRLLVAAKLGKTRLIDNIAV
jgi:pantoate--beta-alanine ligase